MATLKLKTPASPVRAARAPVRGSGSAPRRRPTLAQAQAERASSAPIEPPRATPAARPRREPLAPARPIATKTARDPFAAPSRQQPVVAASVPEVPVSMRLSKRMSELGLASRREADEWIPKGWVRVDGRVVDELGSRVAPDQVITLDPRAKTAQRLKVTVLIHKPMGYVSGQAEDDYQPASVLVTYANQWREDRSGIRLIHAHLRGLAPAGRLDIDSVGLLVLTQDGRIAKQLIGQDRAVDKEYLVRVQRPDRSPVPDADLALLRVGLELDGEALLPAEVERINDDQLRFVLREGKKRQIRRMCEAVGLTVLGLKRVRIGRIMLGDLPPGQWRYLRDDESFD